MSKSNSLALQAAISIREVGQGTWLDFISTLLGFFIKLAKKLMSLFM